jgi:NifU-like protein involved in Fe-S cluster formation
MADLDDIYSERLIALAAAIPRARRLDRPDATASRRAKLCGSTITVDLSLDGDRVTDFGQEVQACLLGQAAASIVGREIVGRTAAEMREVGAEMRAMLTAGGPPPKGRWADLALLAPVRDYPHRHASTLLVFDALEDALSKVAAGSGEQAPLRRTGV